MRAAGLGSVAAGAALHPVGATATATVRDAGPVGPPLGPEEERILALAALAPSGHNTQPWAVRISERRRWIVGVDPARLLPAVDPANREIALSMGAFLEHMAVAADALGLDTEVERVGSARDAPDLLSLRLAPARPGREADLERIRQRRTLRRGYRDDALRRDHLDALLAAHGGRAAWFPRGSREAAWLAEAEVEAFRKQAWRDDAQRELSRWFRFSEADVARHRDGLTPATIEAGAVARLYMRAFMDGEAVMTKRFRESGIELAAEQVKRGAGWLVATAPDESVGALLDAGRSFARMALLLRERMIAAHPMSQLLEEEPWRSKVAQELRLSGIPQFALRVGYVDDYPEPVSPRRAPAAFARVAA